MHLNLDDRRSWIKTHEVNAFIWNDDYIPFGITKASMTAGLLATYPMRSPKDV